MRWGLDGKLIDFGKREAVPTRFLVGEMLEFVEDVVDELDIREEVFYAETILECGTSADRQLATYSETNDFTAVVDRLVAETKEGL